MANSGKVANGHCSSGPGAEVAQAHRQELVEQRQLVAAGRAPVPGGEGEDHTYSPPVNLLFVPAIDWATTIKLGDPSTLKKEPGKPFIGSANAFGDQDPKDQRFGHQPHPTTWIEVRHELSSLGTNWTTRTRRC